MSGFQSRFDWYAATFDGFGPHHIPDALQALLGGSVSLGRGKNGYRDVAVLERDESVLARVFTGSAREGEVHVVTTSDACDETVPVMRRLWPEHRVSRADVAMDFAAEFDVLDGQALDFAAERGISHKFFGNSEGGATRYLGSTSSEVFIRVYKKSEELRQRHPDRASEIPDGIVRAELVARPGTRLKGRVALMGPDELWGLGAWTKDFAARFLQIDAARVPTHFRQPSDWSRSVYWMGEQYRPLMAKRIAQVGLDATRQEVLLRLGLADG